MVELIDSLKMRFNRLVDNRICIGVTGLSQSGKSTFITSLINQLTQHDAKNAKLGRFDAANNHRIHLVKLHPLEDRTLPLFDYDGAIRGLSGDQPRWPQSTTDLSGVLIELVLKQGRGLLGRDSFKRVFIEIRDYPGEWLVDLPMMRLSFAQWSRSIQAQLSREPRASLEDNPLPALSAVNPLQPYDPVVIQKLQRLYRDFLLKCRNQSPPLSLLQPGRFVQPGQFRDDPILDFIPLTACSQLGDDALKDADKGSYYRLLEQRYEQYKSVCLKGFFDQFIAPVSHQVVLVDVLNVLNGGPEYLADMVDALDQISSSFKYKRGLFSSNIEQVHYIATKVDHTHIQDHDNITHLLAAVVKRSLEQVKEHRVRFKVDSVASVRSSVEDMDQRSGSPAIRALDANGKVIKYGPPRIPDHIPDGAEWDAFAGWRWPQLSPPKGTRVAQDQAIQHIRMDWVIESLIGELCR